VSRFDRPVPVPEGWTGVPLVDIGANLTDASLHPHLDVLLDRAASVGVGHQLVTGTDLPHSSTAATLVAERPEHLSATAGVHPHHADEVAEGWLEDLRRLLALDGVRAVGETGLDFNRDFSPRGDQERVFAAQLDLAEETGLPLFLHERDTDGRLFEVMRPWIGRVHGVLHCFTGTEADLDAALDAGLHVGVTGWVCDERRGERLQRLVPRIPDERLLVETDAPYLLPRTIRPRPKSRRNEPALLPWVVTTVAELRGQSPEDVARITTANARELFGLPDSR
jgi:TatD DNase family protein